MNENGACVWGFEYPRDGYGFLSLTQGHVMLSRCRTLRRRTAPPMTRPEELGAGWPVCSLINSRLSVSKSGLAQPSSKVEHALVMLAIS